MKLPRRVRTKAKHAEVDADKLGKLIRLLGSDKDGEILAAAAARSGRPTATISGYPGP